MKSKKRQIKSLVNTKRQGISSVWKRRRFPIRTYNYNRAPRNTAFTTKLGKISSVVHSPNITNRARSTSRKLYSPLYSKSLKRKIPCTEKLKKNDSARRHAFFKAKYKGGSSSRPEHTRKHKRTC